MVLGLDARFKFDEMMWAVEALDSKVSTGKVVLSESVHQESCAPLKLSEADLISLNTSEVTEVP